MDQEGIKKFLESHEPRKQRTIVIVDFSNVEKWKESNGWQVGIQELASLIKHFSNGSQQLRRFYYGSDFGRNEKSTVMVPWSEQLIRRARMNRFEIVTKRVKYMHDRGEFKKKCDLDVEMTLDLIRLKDSYDHIVLFSGDGDLACVLKYLKEEFGKTVHIFTARNHVGRELIDAHNQGIIETILFAEDFEYRLNKDRFRK